MSAHKKRIVVACPTSWDEHNLAHSTFARDYAFEFVGAELMADEPKLLEALAFDPFRFVEELAARLEQQDVAGVIGEGDYPGCMLGAMLAERLGLPAPPPDEVVRLSHKFFSRQVQARAVPEATPRFAPLDPDAPRPELPFPFFVKPVKGTMSIRARHVADARELKEAVRFSLRDRLRLFLLLRPYQALLRHYGDGAVPAHFFIAEEPLRGEQVTVDGFVQNRKVTPMGVVDSVMFPGTMSFQRFEYPSRHPPEAVARMMDVAKRAIEATRLDHSCFNVELFYEPGSGKISIIEINPRMSYQFADLYERIDGQNTYALKLKIATGEPVRWTPGAGPQRAAASFVLRRFTNALVESAPTHDDVARVEARFPGTVVKILCENGKKLSDYDQDVGSFRYGIVNMAAGSRDALHAAWAEAQALLPFTLRDI